MTKITTIALLGLLLMLAGCQSDSNGTDEPQAYEPTADSQIGAVAKSAPIPADAVIAPDFTLKNYDGTEVSLSDYKGRHVVLEWTNPGCPYVQDQCKSGTFKRIAEQYAGQGVVWLAIDSTNSNTAERSKKWAEQYNLPYPILDDKSGEVGKKYGAKTTPHLFVISPAGYILYDGAIDDNQKIGEECNVNYVEQCLEESLAGKAVAVPKTKSYGCGVHYAK